MRDVDGRQAVRAGGGQAVGLGRTLRFALWRSRTCLLAFVAETERRVTNLNSWSAHADVVSQLGDVATAGNYCIFEVSLSGGTSHVVESSRTTWTRSNDSIVEAANVQARVGPRATQGTCRLSCMAHAQKLHRLSTQSLYTDSLHRRSTQTFVAKQPRNRGGDPRSVSVRCAPAASACSKKRDAAGAGAICCSGNCAIGSEPSCTRVARVRVI